MATRVALRAASIALHRQLICRCFHGQFAPSLTAFLALAGMEGSLRPSLFQVFLGTQQKTLDADKCTDTRDFFAHIPFVGTTPPPPRLPCAVRRAPSPLRHRQSPPCHTGYGQLINARQRIDQGLVQTGCRLEANQGERPHMGLRAVPVSWVVLHLIPLPIPLTQSGGGMTSEPRGRQGRLESLQEERSPAGILSSINPAGAGSTRRCRQERQQRWGAHLGGYWSLPEPAPGLGVAATARQHGYRCGLPP